MPPGLNILYFFVVSSDSTSTKSLQDSLSPAILTYLGVFSSTATAAVYSATLSVVVNSKICLALPQHKIFFYLKSIKGMSVVSRSINGPLKKVVALIGVWAMYL
ncbi:MAG: hypothetical protein ACI87N_003195 [Flavobacteriales bacterium]|jgi:hypothetical protein